MNADKQPTVVDALTGLPNWHAFTAFLDTAVVEAKASGSLLSLLYVDLDKFKSFNDALGHAEGDCLLLQVARTAQEVLGSEVQLYRMGGDEFIVLLGMDMDDAIAIGEQLRGAVARNTPITVTVGVASRPAGVDGWDARLLLTVADARLDYAKSYDRRNRVIAEHLPAERECAAMREARWPGRHGGANSISSHADG